MVRDDSLRMPEARSRHCLIVLGNLSRSINNNAYVLVHKGRDVKRDDACKGLARMGGKCNRKKANILKMNQAARD